MSLIFKSDSYAQVNEHLRKLTRLKCVYVLGELHKDIIVSKYCYVRIITDIRYLLETLLVPCEDINIILFDNNLPRDIMYKEWFTRLFECGKYYNVAAYVMCNSISSLPKYIRDNTLCGG